MQLMPLLRRPPMVDSRIRSSPRRIDTPADPLENFNAKEARNLMEDQVSMINEFVHLLQSMVAELEPNPEVTAFTQKTLSMHHFSRTQSLQLEKLLR